MILCGLLTACSALATPVMTETPPPATPLPSPSATIAWFPPSTTPSPQVFATYTATPEMRPSLGPVLLQDDFSVESEGLWDTATSDQGSASIDRNRLTLAVQAGVYLISLHHDLAANNFYAEITARLSLCRGDDDYGLLVRANAVAYYRFALSCNGTARAERISVNTRQPLQAPIASGDAPPGAPGEVRIGVWAVGAEMRLFLNGRYQFSIHDSNYRTGTIGVFAHSAGDTPVTINFSDFMLQEVTYSPPTRTPMP